MSSSDRLKTLLLDALDLPDEQRTAFLERECGQDLELRARLHELLAAHRRADAALGSETVPLARMLEGGASGVEPGAGDRVGPYVIESELGSGGFGVVFRATQEKPVRRQVALKVVKHGMDTQAVIARFELERQALALMDHPNIARVFDAGETDAGRPYFAMELVDGVPITEYCDRKNLDISGRVRLFAKAARAVHHAHQRGVLHRDIKPSNVLVAFTSGEARDEGGAQPKVIDFGIAKATGDPLTDVTLHTREGFLLGTPAYMSPEQVDGARDIDTRTDVYSLGVLLYELISGVPPFDVDRLGIVDAFKTIREQDPPRPSTRRRRAAQTGATRKGDPERDLRVPKELDWIVMRCLEKERERRYESAQALAADAERFLADEPLEAAPPSRGYRARKWVRRNRAAAAGLSGVALALLLGTVGTTFGMLRAERSNAQLDEALLETKATNAELDASLQETTVANERLDQALVEAERQTRIAEAVNDFLIQDLLGSARPTGAAGSGPAMPIGELLDIAARELEAASRPGGRFAQQPQVEASLRYTLGVTYGTLGKFEESAHHLERCVELQADSGAVTERILALSYLGTVRRSQGIFEESVALQGEAHELSLELLGATDVDTLRSGARLASALREVGRSEEAIELLEETLPIARESQGERAAVVTDLAGALAILYADDGRFDESNEMFREVLDTQIFLLGPESPVVLNSKMNIATLARALERFEESEILYREVLDVQQRVEGREHPHTITTLVNLAECMIQMERFDEALEILEEFSAAVERAYGPAHPRTFLWLSTQGQALLGLGRVDEAEACLLDAYERTHAAYGAADPRTLAAAEALDELSLQ